VSTRGVVWCVCRYVFNEVNHRYPTLPFTLRALEDERQARMGVVECLKHDLIHPYPVSGAGDSVVNWMSSAVMWGVPLLHPDPVSPGHRPSLFGDLYNHLGLLFSISQPLRPATHRLGPLRDVSPCLGPDVEPQCRRC
jgi:hypothetical protein